MLDDKYRQAPTRGDILVKDKNNQFTDVSKIISDQYVIFFPQLIDMEMGYGLQF